MAESDDWMSSFMEAVNAAKKPARSPVMSVPTKIITVALSIANISLGSIYFHSCPVQYLIPYYLIIFGISSLVLILLFSLPCKNDVEPSKALRAFQVIFSLFNIAFFIAGNVWIYSVYAPNYTDRDDPEYCNKVLYLYAFWTTTIFYIILGLSLLGSFVAFLCCCCGILRCTAQLQDA